MTLTLTEMPVDLCLTDEFAREIAFMMVLNRDMWPADRLAMKRMFSIETETGIRFHYRSFGVMLEAREPIQIHDRDSGEIMEYPTIRDMLRDGWMVD